MIPNCLDKCVDRRDGNYIVHDTQLRAMTPEDMDQILYHTKIGYQSPIYHEDDGYVRQARGLSYQCGIITLDPEFDMNEVLIHEAGHLFYGRFGFYEPNNVMWTKDKAELPEYKKIAQKHIVRTIPDELYWDLEDLDVYTLNVEIISDEVWDGD